MPLEFHAIANDYPLMSEEELAAVVEDMQAHGFDPRFPIVTYEGKILAGRDRYRAAVAACVTPRFVELAKGEDPHEFVRRENELRKRFTPEFLAARRKARIERVAALRKQGSSQREIAESVGVSRSQVREDLASAAGQGCPAEPKNGRVVGSDGKSQPARKPKPPAPPPQREPGDDTEAEAAPPPPSPKPDGMEEWNRLLEAWARDTVAARMDALPAGPWLDDNMRAIIEGQLKSAAGQARSLKGYGPCPKCQAAGCKVCRGTGWMDRVSFESHGGKK